jgi:hypothetical protein
VKRNSPISVCSLTHRLGGFTRAQIARRWNHSLVELVAVTAAECVDAIFWDVKPYSPVSSYQTVLHFRRAVVVVNMLLLLLLLLVVILNVFKRMRFLIHNINPILLHVNSIGHNSP